MENVSLLDLVSIALILFLGIKGILRGFVKEVFGLIGIIGGIFIASKYAQVAGEYADANFLNLQNKASIYLIGFIAVLILFWIIATFVGSMLGKLVNSSGLGIVDKILGFIVGGAKIFLIFSVIIYVLSSIGIFRSSLNSIFEGSMMYPIFKEVGSKIVQIDPSQLNEKAVEKINVQSE
ncbi:MAG TPA: CvpA family protein [Campylobacterales bacterium]|nr:CvpA family protein [Campylobacterales bacterium]HIP59609.1 CvpA family protein [Campylobacterales bacterium]